MSEPQRNTSRTTGRVERRGAPAPYTPTKPAPKPKKNPSSIWDFIKYWSFFGSNKDTDNEEPEHTPEPRSPTDAPSSLQDIISRHRTASPKLHEAQGAIVAMQAKATKNLYERGLEIQREHEQMIQEIGPPSTSPSEPIEEKPAPKVYHMPFYHRPGTKEWFVANITKHIGKSPNEVVANYLMAKGETTEPINDIESSAIRDVLLNLKPQKKATPPPVPRSNRQPTGLEILARIEPKEPEIPVFIDEWITKPKWEYCPTAENFWDGIIYANRPRDIPPGMEYRSFSGGSGYIAKKRPGGFLNTDPPPRPTSKRPRHGDGGLSASTSGSTSLSLPTKSTDPGLFIPYTSTSKPPPPPPLISAGKTQPFAESQKNNETPEKGTPLKKSQTYRTMQEIVIEEAAKKAAEEKERQMKELIDKAIAALDGGAGRYPIRKDRPILRYDTGQGPSFKKKQPKKEQAKKVPTVNDILDIHTGRADPSQFDASAADTSAHVPRPPVMKPYDPTPRKRSPKRSLEEHQQEHGEMEMAETSPKKKVKTNGDVLVSHVQAASGSGIAAEDAIVIDDLDEEINETSARAPAPTILVPVPTPAPAPTKASSMPPPPTKPRAVPNLAPVNPLAPPYARAFSPSRPSPLRMVSSVDSPEGSPHPTPFPIFNPKLKPKLEVIDVDAEEEDQLAEDGNENAPTPASTSIVGAPPVPAPIFKPAPAPVTQPKSQPITNSWSIPTPKDTQLVPPMSPKSIARNAPADSLPDYSKTLSGTSLCYDVVMGEPEARTIARTAPQDELPAFVIGLSPMFDPTPWIERRNTGPRVRAAPASTQVVAPVRQAGTTRSWAAAGLELTSSDLKSKDTATKYSVRDAPEPGAPITSTLTTPVFALKPAPVPLAAPAPVRPVPFDWAAAGLKPSTPVAGEWTCTECNCKTKDTLSKCSVCETPKPGAAASPPTSAPRPMSPPMPALIPAPAPLKATPVAFNWAAAGLNPPTKPPGTWTCPCAIDNKPEADHCIACATLRPNSNSAPLANGFKLPPPIRNNGFNWSIPPSSIVASEPVINGN